MKNLILSLVALVSLVNQAVANENITSQIEWLSVYTEYGNGDAAFTTTTKGTICFGYWIPAASPGFDQVYSTVLSAYHAGKAIELSVSQSESSRWPASSNHYCKVVRVAMGQ